MASAKKEALRVLKANLGAAEDNLYRFNKALKASSAPDSEWGKSGKTLREWTDEAREQAKLAAAALDWAIPR